MSILVACLVIGADVSGQSPRPKPKAASHAGGAQLPGALLVKVDDGATVSIDGRTAGRYNEGDVKTVRVALGKHLIRATSTRAAGVFWEGVVDVGEASQQIVQVLLKEQADRTLRLASRRTGSIAQPDAPVVVVVDGGLEQAALAEAVGLQRLRIWLESSAGETLGPEAPTLSSVIHAELSEPSQASVSPVSVGANAMQSCSVTVTLSVWKRARPMTSSFTETGAAFTPSQACATARQRSVTSALRALANSIRKDGR